MRKRLQGGAEGVLRIRAIQISDEVRVPLLYEKYERLARSVGRIVARRFGRRGYELEDEALSLLGKYLFEEWSSFDPSKSSSCTWLRHKIYFALMNQCIKNRRTNQREVSDEKEVEPICPGRSRIERILSDLEKEGRALLKIVIQAPGDLAYCLSPAAPTRSRFALRSYLENRRWSSKKILRAWDQITQAIIDN